MNVENRIVKALEEREAQNSLRNLSLPLGTVDFSSNDYLGLGKSLVHLEGKLKAGSGGSRLITGNYEEIELLEQKLALLGKSEAALIYGSGYSANIGLLSCVPQKNDVVLYDQWVHASLRDGIRLSHAAAYSFLHNDCVHLEERIKKFSDVKGALFVVIESVYSMDGDGPDFEQMALLQKKYNFQWIVDEAHSFGLYGTKGAGLTESLGLVEQIFARVITFGKAMGCDGAAVLGSAKLREYLINFSRSFIYTTGPSPHKVALMEHQLNHLMHVQNRNEKAQELKQALVKAFSGEQISTGVYGNIVSILFPGNDHARAAAKHLQSCGLDTRAILSPTVPEGQERLRICLHDFNTREEVELLIKELKGLMS